ncbi:MAG: hypothetical protein ACREQQ_00670 [Candidatus Binatia bacterium]
METRKLRCLRVDRGGLEDQPRGAAPVPLEAEVGEDRERLLGGRGACDLVAFLEAL